MQFNLIFVAPLDALEILIKKENLEDHSVWSMAELILQIFLYSHKISTLDPFEVA